MTMVTHDDNSQNIYSVPFEWYNEYTSVEEYKYEEKPKSSLIVPGEPISKKESGKIPEKKTMRLYIVPGERTLFYQQGNNNSCILLSLVSALNYMGDEYTS